MTGSASCLRRLSLTKYNTRKPLRPALSKNKMDFHLFSRKTKNKNSKQTKKGVVIILWRKYVGLSAWFQRRRKKQWGENVILFMKCHITPAWKLPAASPPAAGFSRRRGSCLHKDTVMARKLELHLFIARSSNRSLPFFKPFLVRRGFTLTQIFTAGPVFLRHPVMRQSGEGEGWGGCRVGEVRCVFYDSETHDLCE